MLIKLTKPDDPNALLEIESSGFQYADGAGIVPFGDAFKLIKFLGDSFGTVVFNVEAGPVTLTGCRITTTGGPNAGFGFRYLAEEATR